MSGKRRFFAIAAALACAVAGWYLLWHNGAFLPRWIIWQSGTIFDASGAYEAALAHKIVSVSCQGDVIWTSPDGVKVQDVLSFDVDNDSEDELVLLCWKIGRYGSERPFWVERDERKWSQHIFVYEYGDGEIRPKWMSSYIGQDVVSIAANNEPAPHSRLLLTDLDGNVSRWAWDSWGFAKEE